MTLLSLIMVMMYSLLMTCFDNLISVISVFSNTSIIFCWQTRTHIRRELQLFVYITAVNSPGKEYWRFTYVDFDEFFLGLSDVESNLGLGCQNTFCFRHHLLHRLHHFLHLKENRKIKFKLNEHDLQEKHQVFYSPVAFLIWTQTSLESFCDSEVEFALFTMFVRSFVNF